MLARHNLICKICDRNFVAIMPFAKYCSKKCKRRATYLFGNEYIPHPRKLTYVNCSYCGKEIRKEPSDLRHSKSGKLYCNKSCKMKAEVKKKTIVRCCNICKKKLFRVPSNSTQNVFCSRKCSGIHNRQFMREKAHNWKGGYDNTERERIRARIAWKKLREYIMKQYKYSCLHCGKKGILHIHHIIPYRLGGEDVLENLIPLCPKCHSTQTVKDWENENRLNWKKYGAHIHKEVVENGA